MNDARRTDLQTVAHAGTVAGPDPVYQVAQALTAIRFSTLPAATVANARRLVLDSLAVALAGQGLPDVQALPKLAVRWGGSPESAVIGTDLRVPAPVAALVNGTMIQALDFDDTHDPSGAHVASSVLAAALAVADMQGRSGADIITALVAGVELTGRLGLACTDKIGWTSTALYGAFGAAAAAAHLLGLDDKQTRHALGIVISQAAGTTQTAIDSPLSKHMQSGFAAKAGVLSALLAAEGVTGVEHVFQGQFGFFALYKAGRYRIEPLVTEWGRHFEIDALSYKPFPSCRGTHGPIEAALALFAEEGVRAENVAGVDVSIPRMAWNLTGKPFTPGESSVVAAQFSTAYTVATALREGAVSLRHFRPDAIGDPSVGRLAGRVRVSIGESDDFFTPARIDLRTANGRTLSRTITRLKGCPEFPMTDAEMLAKVEDCLAFAPSHAAAISATELWRRVDGLATMDGTGGLVRALTQESSVATAASQ